MADNRLVDVLSDCEDNYILPFYWQRGNHRECIPAQVQRIFDSGCRALCVESRPHPDFCGPEWWADMDVILSECEKRGMKVWVLDDKRFPTGYANGMIEKKYPHLRQRTVIEEHVDVLGPAPNTAFIVQTLPDEEILGIYAFRRTDEGEETVGGYIDLTPTIKGDYAYWDVPEGLYRVYTYVKTCRGSRANYIDMTNPESCAVQIEAVYQPHYEHYAKYFGKTFLGFFSDEPMFGNSLVTRRPNSPDGKFNPMGTVGMAWPFHQNVIDLMSEEMGEYSLPYLSELWYMSEHAHITRHAYMNAITRLYRDNFSYQIGNWCREHGVMYIGHVIEDDNAHARTGAGAGHYFRALEGQDMSGIDVVLHQVMPGMAHHIHQTSTNVGSVDPTFYHYVLGQLGASLAHQYPQMRGRAMCEEFGAYGWAAGSSMMKWITDFLLVRGINHFVPHAFSPDYPDPDCPPHFGAEGHDPQFEGFTHLMKYTNKAAHLLYGGRHIVSCAVLYHAESEWMNRAGECMLTQIPAKALLDEHLCYDIVCLDALENASVVNGKMVINGETYGALVIPYGKHLPHALHTVVAKLCDNGVPVFLCGDRPRGLDGEVISVDELPARIRELGLADITVKQSCPLLRHYHIKRDDAHIFMFFNEDLVHTADTQVILPVSGEFVRLRLAEDGIFGDTAVDGEAKVSLLPGQSEIWIFGETAKTVHVSLPRITSPTKVTILAPTYEINLADADDLSAFCYYKTTNQLVSITSPSEMPGFSGLMRYSFTLHIEDVSQEVVLDLGAVGETAILFVNDHRVGMRIAAPYTYPITSFLHEGDNLVTVEVANTLVGKVRDRFSRCMSIAPSGLLGPVRLWETESK